VSGSGLLWPAPVLRRGLDAALGTAGVAVGIGWAMLICFVSRAETQSPPTWASCRPGQDYRANCLDFAYNEPVISLYVIACPTTD
jgi:hypothetical protein